MYGYGEIPVVRPKKKSPSLAVLSNFQTIKSPRQGPIDLLVPTEVSLQVGHCPLRSRWKKLTWLLQ